MTKHLLAGVAAVILMSGVASAQSYLPAPPVPYPPPTLPYPPPPVPVAPQSAVPESGTSTTTVNPTPDGGYRASTTKKSLDPNGNEVTRKDVYRKGVAGSSETHAKTETAPFGGNHDPLHDHHHAAVNTPLPAANIGAGNSSTEAVDNPVDKSGR